MAHWAFPRVASVCLHVSAAIFNFTRDLLFSLASHRCNLKAKCKVRLYNIHLFVCWLRKQVVFNDLHVTETRRGLWDGLVHTMLVMNFFMIGIDQWPWKFTSLRTCKLTQESAIYPILPQNITGTQMFPSFYYASQIMDPNHHKWCTFEKGKLQDSIFHHFIMASSWLGIATYWDVDSEYTIF